MLSVSVDNTVYGILLEQVHHIDYPDTPTPLPWGFAPIEGVARVNGHPIVQVNVAEALGVAQQTRQEGRIVVLALPQGYLALKVDAVLELRDRRELSLLTAERLGAWIGACRNHPLENIHPTTTPIEPDHAQGHILVVASGGHTLGLRANNVARIEQVGEILPQRGHDSDAGCLIRVDNRVMPARSMACLLGVPDRVECLALVLQDAEQPVALLVERVLNLEKVDSFQMTTSQSGFKRLWHVRSHGDVIEVVDAKTFFDKETDIHASIPVDTPLAHWRFLPKLAAKLDSEGLRIYCGNVICVIPTILVERILDDPPESDELPQRKGHLAVIDCARLMHQPDNSPEHCHILLSLPDGRVLLKVQRAELRAALPGQNWQPLTLLPPPAATLFDAASFDETANQWVWRLSPSFRFNRFSWRLKCLLASAMLGRKRSVPLL